MRGDSARGAAWCCAAVLWGATWFAVAFHVGPLWAIGLACLGSFLAGFLHAALRDAWRWYVAHRRRCPSRWTHPAFVPVRCECARGHAGPHEGERPSFFYGGETVRIAWE